MGRCAEIRDRLEEARVLEILACYQYQPTPEKCRALARSYALDPHTRVYGWVEGDFVQGVVVLRPLEGRHTEIRGIAVHPSCRNQGIATRMLTEVLALESAQVLVAETDDDAVGFYRCFGFETEDLGMKYAGTRRYRCVYTLPGRQEK